MPAINVNEPDWACYVIAFPQVCILLWAIAALVILAAIV